MQPHTQWVKRDAGEATPARQLFGLAYKDNLYHQSVNGRWYFYTLFYCCDIAPVTPFVGMWIEICPNASAAKKTMRGR